MKYYVFMAGALFCMLSCKMQSGSSRQYDEYSPDKVYKLKLGPDSGAVYHFDIINESELKVEVGDKKVDNMTRNEMGINYRVGKDSSHNFLFQMTYDKVHLKTKNGDMESEEDADHAEMSLDPVERMLGILKKATIRAVVSPAGEIKSMTGYDQVRDQLLAGLDPNDAQAREIARSQWDRLIGGGVVKNNMDQFFRIFPDSAVHIRDTWKISSTQEGDFPVSVRSIFTLKAINNDIAMISSTGSITADTKMMTMDGFGSVTPDLKGEQEGEYEIETKTGMLLSSTIKTYIKGSIQVMGREIPVTVRTSIEMKGVRK